MLCEEGGQVMEMQSRPVARSSSAEGEGRAGHALNIVKPTWT
jgi:hypothetical protein